MIAIVGGGPAGLSIAAALEELGSTSHVVIDNFSGSTALAHYPDVRWHSTPTELQLNFPIFKDLLLSDPVDTSSYRAYLQNCRRRIPTDRQIDGRVESLSETPNGEWEIVLRGSPNRLLATAVVLATGLRDHARIPQVTGLGPPVNTTWSSDWKDRRIVVVGSGAMAWDATYYLAQRNQVFWILRAEKWRPPFHRLNSHFDVLHRKAHKNIVYLPSADLHFLSHDLLQVGEVICVPDVHHIVSCCGADFTWPEFLKPVDGKSLPPFGVRPDGSTSLGGLWVVGSLSSGPLGISGAQFVSSGRPKDRRLLAAQLLNERSPTATFKKANL